MLAHFIWAFSLMFLYSGRGYWQELIESILWAHHKLKIINNIQPRALSISQGRAVGLIHYILGGVGCTSAFVISIGLGLSLRFTHISSKMRYLSVSSRLLLFVHQIGMGE